MDLLQRKALLAMLAQSREHADNAVKLAPPVAFGEPEAAYVVELRESNRLLADVLEKLVKDPVG